MIRMRKIIAPLCLVGWWSPLVYDIFFRFAKPPFWLGVSRDDVHGWQPGWIPEKKKKNRPPQRGSALWRFWRSCDETEMRWPNQESMVFLVLGSLNIRSFGGVWTNSQQHGGYSNLKDVHPNLDFKTWSNDILFDFQRTCLWPKTRCLRTLFEHLYIRWCLAGRFIIIGQAVMVSRRDGPDPLVIHGNGKLSVDQGVPGGSGYFIDQFSVR